jgi:hypothetical protein
MRDTPHTTGPARQNASTGGSNCVDGRRHVVFVSVRKILQPVTPWAEAVFPEIIAEKIGWAVETAGRIVPTGNNCLVKAIAAREMLARRGVGSRLRLGIAKNSPDILLGHAWLECGDRIVTGEGEYRRYAAMPVGEPYAEGTGFAGADGVAPASSSVKNP